jgi:hypothetical protein
VNGNRKGESKKEKSERIKRKDRKRETMRANASQFR